MNKQAFWLSLIVLGVSPALYPQAAAQPGKVGIIHIQNAIIGTKDGQKAAADLQTKFDPRRKQLEAKQGEIAGLQDQLRKGSNTMSEDARQKLVREIDQRTKSLQRDTEDAQAEFDQEQGRVLQDLGQKLMAVIDKYARDNGFTLILDVSAPQNPVLYAATTIDITSEIVALYDKNAPSTVPAGTPSLPRPAITTPARPITKKP